MAEGDQNRCVGWRKVAGVDLARSMIACRLIFHPVYTISGITDLYTFVFLSLSLSLCPIATIGSLALARPLQILLEVSTVLLAPKDMKKARGR